MLFFLFGFVILNFVNEVFCLKLVYWMKFFRNFFEKDNLLCECLCVIVRKIKFEICMRKMSWF